MATYVIYPIDEQEKFMKAFLEAMEFLLLKMAKKNYRPMCWPELHADKPILKREDLSRMRSLRKNSRLYNGINVIFSDEAGDTFESIGEQIRIRWGDREVAEFRKRTYKVVAIICKFPLIFEAANKTGNIRKAFIHKNCSMFYSVNENRIEILFFWIIGRIRFFIKKS